MMLSSRLTHGGWRAVSPPSSANWAASLFSALFPTNQKDLLVYKRCTVMANQSDFSFRHKRNLAKVKCRWHPYLKFINFWTANRTKQPETLLLLTNWSSIRCIVPEQHFIIDMNNSDRFLFWQKSAVEGVNSKASNLLQFVIHTTFHVMAFRHYNVYAMWGEKITRFVSHKENIIHLGITKGAKELATIKVKSYSFWTDWSVKTFHFNIALK